MFANTTRILILTAAMAVIMPAFASAGDAAAGKIVFGWRKVEVDSPCDIFGGIVQLPVESDARGNPANQ